MNYNTTNETAQYERLLEDAVILAERGNFREAEANLEVVMGHMEKIDADDTQSDLAVVLLIKYANAYGSVNDLKQGNGTHTEK